MSDKLTEAEAAQLQRIARIMDMNQADLIGSVMEDGSLIEYQHAICTALPRLLSERRATATALKEAREALEIARIEIEGLAEQQAMPDDSWRAAHGKIRAALARIKEHTDG